jgi:glycosyltransferase involved in cell wall biosynthesis
MPLKILTLTNCPLDSTLGSGRTVIRYSEGLRALGHEVDVLAPEEYEVWSGLGRGKKLRQAAGAAAAVARRLRQNRYDVLECYGAEFWPALMGLPRGFRRPFVVAHTNGLELLHRDREQIYMAEERRARSGPLQVLACGLDWQLTRRFFEHSDGFVSLCELDRSYVVQRSLFPPAMTEVVEPGLDDEFHRIDEPVLDARDQLVCFVGSWIPRKGVRWIVEAMTRVLRRSPIVKFEAFGTRSDSAIVTSPFPNDVRGRVTVHPEISNSALALALRRGKVFIFPSEYEGYGMALAEAMACGLAAVTTPTGLGAALNHGREALICDFGDVDSMAESVLLLLEDDERRCSIARAGWQRVQSLRWGASVERLAATYSRWVD